MKAKFIILAFVLLLCSNAFAYDFSAVCESGHTLFYNIISYTEPYTVEITCEHMFSDDVISPYYTDYLIGSLVIPSSVTYNEITYSVKNIGNHAFWCCRGLTSVTIPHTITTIDFNAFGSCDSLNAVYYTGSIKQWCEIDFVSNPLGSAHNLYIDNTLITNLILPNTLTEIKPLAFSGATCLTSVAIPNSIITIGRGSFLGCSNLVSVQIGDYVTHIGEMTFSRCSSLPSIVIPNSVTYLGDEAFRDCNALNTVILSNSLTTIRNDVFSGCSNLETINIPEGILSIGERAFDMCFNLAYVNLPTTLNSICNCAFRSCRSLESVIIPNSVTSIGGSAFASCNNLSEIIIPNSVTTIGAGTFMDCSSLASIQGDSVSHIGNSAFSGCSALTSIDIPNSVIDIDNYAFRYCNQLQDISISNSVRDIGIGVFDDTQWYNDQPDGLLYLDDWCLGYKTSHLESNIIIREGTKGIANFKECGWICNVEMPSSLRYISSRAFYNCQSLKSVSLPDSLLYIGDGAFGSSGIEEFTLPVSLELIGKGIFSSCRNLKRINYNARNSMVRGNGIIYDLQQISVLTIGDCVMSIPQYAFRDCNLNMPGCHNLDTIYSLAFNPPMTSDSTFVDVATWHVHLIVPCGRASAYNNAEYWSDFSSIQEDCTDVEENEIADADLQIFPNPVSNTLNITSSETISEIEIVNVMGQVVYRTEVIDNNAVCDVNELANGIYVAKIRTMNLSKVIQRKFIKE